MTQPLSIDLIKRLCRWPSLQESVLKNSLVLIDGSAEAARSEDTHEDMPSEGMEDNPALEGHFLTERSSLDVSVLDSCVCKCHRDQTTTLKLSLPFSCSKCRQQFCCKCQFLVHREFHRGERKYECDTCGKAYYYKSDLVRHQPVHSQVKPHVCKVCGRSFNQVGHLITHRLVHTGEKPFSCDICHKPFNRKSNLQKHKMIHTGERPFQCLTCSSRFSRKGDLQRHSMLHTGERPYKCDVCDKSFSQKPHLVSHSAVHTGERPYKCQACGRSFNRKNHLLKHQIEKCAELTIRGSDGSDLSLGDFTNLSSNSFFNLNHLLAKDVDNEESTVEKSYFESINSLKSKVLQKSKKLTSDRSDLCEPNGTSLLRARLSDPSFASSGGEEVGSNTSAKSSEIDRKLKLKSVGKKNIREISESSPPPSEEEEYLGSCNESDDSDFPLIKVTAKSTDASHQSTNS